MLSKTQNILIKFVVFIPFSTYFSASKNSFIHPVGGGGGLDLEAHEAVGRDNVRFDLEGALGVTLGDIHDDVWSVVGC